MSTSHLLEAVELDGTVTCINDHSTCCLFLGVRLRENDRVVSVVEFARDDHPDLAESTDTIEIGDDIVVTVEPFTIGTTRFIGRSVSLSEASR